MARPSGTGRAAVSAATLYALLSQAFQARRDPRCSSCRVPLPIYRPPLDASNANWHTGSLGVCRYRCHLVLGEVQAELWRHYDLRLEREPDIPA